MATPGRLEVDKSSGHLTGGATISYNDPFPCVNGDLNTTGAMQGVLMHTTDGTFQSCIEAFNVPGANKSANFVIGIDGHIHQFGPVGQGWMAWHAEGANLTWYGIEHADNGNPDTPLSAAQIIASAQLVEVLSRFAGFPLQVTDRPAGRGYGTHSMGGAAWGGHTCPDLPPQHVRSQQRQGIVDLAKEIRNPPPSWQSQALAAVENAAAALAKAHSLLGANQ